MIDAIDADDAWCPPTLTPERAGRTRFAWWTMETASQSTRRFARDLPEVQAVFTLAGDPDAVVWMRVRDSGHLAATIDRLRRSGRITETKTMMILHTWRPGDL